MTRSPNVQSSLLCPRSRGHSKKMALGRLTIGLGVGGRPSAKRAAFYILVFCSPSPGSKRQVVLRQPGFKSKGAAIVLRQPLEKREGQGNPFFSSLQNPASTTVTRSIDRSIGSLARSHEPPSLALLPQTPTKSCLAPFSAERESGSSPGPAFIGTTPIKRT